MSESTTCPKCNQALGRGESSDYLAAFRTHESCPYEACDAHNCRALKNPVTLKEWQEAAKHWKTHSLMYGCSHGN